MAIGKRPEGRQESLFVATSEIRRLSHPFYRVLERLLQAGGFDAFAEETCREFYAPRRGRPSIPPGVYFRDAAGGVSGRGRFGARDCMALRGLDFAAGVSWLRVVEQPAGSFQRIAHAPAAEPGGARGGSPGCLSGCARRGC